MLASAATSGINAEVLSGKRLLTAVAGTLPPKRWPVSCMQTLYGACTLLLAGVAKEQKEREHKEALGKCFTNPLVNKDTGKRKPLASCENRSIARLLGEVLILVATAVPAGIIDILRGSNPSKVQEKKQIANRSFAVADVPLLLHLLFGKPTAKVPTLTSSCDCCL